MRFIQKNIIQNIYTFFLSKDDNYILIDDKFNLIFNSKIIEASSVLFENNMALGFNSNFKSNLFLIKTNELKVFNTLNKIVVVINSDIVVESYQSSDNINYDERLVNLKTKEILFDFKDFSSSRIFFDSKSFNIFSKKNNPKTIFISCFSFTKIDYLWHYNIETLYESHPAQMAEYLADPINSQYYKPIVGHLIGVHNGLLWLDINMTYHSNFLLALDAETGAVAHFLQHIHPQKDFDGVCIDGRPNRMPMYSQTHLDEKRNILFGFGADIFHWQVDLNDEYPKIKMWDLGIEAKNAKGHFSALANCGVSDSHVFFPVGSIGGISPGVIGLNRDTLEVDYRLYLEPTKDYYTPTKIKVSDTHLFVLDNNSTLSIFEKVED